jgi:CRISPR-associated endonuclease/helicase Cas3
MENVTLSSSESTLNASVAKRSDRGVFQTFSGHITDCLSVADELWKVQGETVYRPLLEKWQFELERFRRLLYLSVIYHDIGKLTDEFQRNIQSNPPRPCQSVSHPFFGLPWINPNLDSEEIAILKLACLSHHSQLYNRIYVDAPLERRVAYREDAIQAFIEVYVRKELERRNIHVPELLPLQIPSQAKSSNAKLEILRQELGHLRRPERWSNERSLLRLKVLYCLLLASLRFCDGRASSVWEKKNRGMPPGIITGSTRRRNRVVLESRQIFEKAKTKLQRLLLYKYQRQAVAAERSCVIFAPCGRGKTEAALLGALSLAEKMGRPRIIFALPTQLTSNAMYLRLCRLFGRNNVGIHHGLSRFVPMQSENKDKGHDEFTHWEDLDHRLFLKPVTVSTVDHIVYSLVHGHKHADYALGQILTSVVIFDEIHYYQFQTLAHLCKTIELLHELDVPSITMSGTLPEFLMERLTYNRAAVPIIDSEGLRYTPFIVKLHSKQLADSLNSIIDNHRRGLRQIVILNTVKRAQDVFRSLSEILPSEELVLYHALLTPYDRAYGPSSKEVAIRKLKKSRQSPWLIVGTQAIELSIDISCDQMHTEWAPPDALGQRAGRLNRGGKTHDDRFILHIYEAENHAPYFLEGKRQNVHADFVSASKEVIQSGPAGYTTVKNWCDRVYSKVPLPESTLNELFNDCLLFGKHPSEVWDETSETTQGGFRFREEAFLRVSVIPDIYVDSVRKDPSRRDLFSVQVPYWWKSKFGADGFYVDVIGQEPRTIPVLVCKLSYDSMTGFSMDDVPVHTAFA